MSGQGKPLRFTRRGAGLLKSAALALGLCAGVHDPALAAPSPAPAERQTPSGMAVPRYVSTKFDRVNARAGPGDDYKLQFVYTGTQDGKPLKEVIDFEIGKDEKSLTLRSETFVAGASAMVLEGKGHK